MLLLVEYSSKNSLYFYHNLHLKAFIIRLDEWLDEYSKFKDNSELIEKREALNYLIKKFEVELHKKIERHNGK